MTSFQKVITAVGLNTDSQGDLGWLFALLTVADGSGGDTHTNPAKEAYRRLEVAGVGAHTLAKIKSMLNTLEQKLDR